MFPIPRLGKLMRVAVLGTGNVGANLVLHLGKLPDIKEIQLYSARKASAVAALLDAASVSPENAQKIKIVDIIDADVVVVSAGLQPYAKSSLSELLDFNKVIASNMLEKVKVSPSTIVIAVATPVDFVTAIVQQLTKLPVTQVIGFGGDLDKNRLCYTLQNKRIICDAITIIGEHGRNAIPVYSGEHEYDGVSKEVQSFLAQTSSVSGVARNLASGELLARLVVSIVEDRRIEHCVTSYHSEFQDWFTWPCIVGRGGVLGLLSPKLGPRSKTAFETLVQARRAENRSD